MRLYVLFTMSACVRCYHSWHHHLHRCLRDTSFHGHGYHIFVYSILIIMVDLFFELIQRISHLDSTTCSQSSLVFVDKTVDSTWYFLAFVSRLGMIIVRFQLCHINDYPHVDYVQLVVPWPRLLGLSSTVMFRLPTVCVHLLCHSSVVHHVQFVLQPSNNRCIGRSCFCA